MTKVSSMRLQCVLKDFLIKIKGGKNNLIKKIKKIEKGGHKGSMYFEENKKNNQNRSFA